VELDNSKWTALETFPRELNNSKWTSDLDRSKVALGVTLHHEVDVISRKWGC
jgi:hypothetical protein